MRHKIDEQRPERVPLFRPAGKQLVERGPLALHLDVTRSVPVELPQHAAGDGLGRREDVRELARVLRLRDCLGTVVVDFPREGEAGRRAAQRALEEASRLDRRHVSLLGWTRGGLYELRRSAEDGGG